MTNKEIKLELARIALERCNSMTSETLTESLKNLYEWITAEPDVEAETEKKSSFDDIDIKEVINTVRKNQRSSSGIATTLETILFNKNINTAGDLVRIGRRDFSKYRLVGKGSLSVLDDALYELGIESW